MGKHKKQVIGNNDIISIGQPKDKGNYLVIFKEESSLDKLTFFNFHSSFIQSYIIYFSASLSHSYLYF